MKKSYNKRTYYHETDQAGVIHHSNFIKWFEEARTFFLDSNGITNSLLAEYGIGLVVLTCECNYKSFVLCDYDIIVDVTIAEISLLQVVFQYTVRNENTIFAVGKTKHCFFSINRKVPVLINGKLSPLLNMFMKVYKDQDMANDCCMFK